MNGAKPVSLSVGRIPAAYEHSVEKDGPMAHVRNSAALRQIAAALVLGAISMMACSCSSSDGDVTNASEQADTANAASITACPDSPPDPSCPSGSFAVICKDGSHEVATVAQIQAGTICSAKTKSVFCELSYKPECHDPSTEDCSAYSVVRVKKEFSGAYPSLDDVIGDKTLPYWGYVRSFGYGNPGDTLGSFEFGITNQEAYWTNRDAWTTYTNHEVDISKVGAQSLLLENLQTKVAPFSYTDPWHTRTHAFVMFDCLLSE
jgi:hypothetical protein